MFCEKCYKNPICSSGLLMSGSKLFLAYVSCLLPCRSFWIVNLPVLVEFIFTMLLFAVVVSTCAAALICTNASLGRFSPSLRQHSLEEACVSRLRASAQKRSVPSSTAQMRIIRTIQLCGVDHSHYPFGFQGVTDIVMEGSPLLPTSVGW